MPRLDEFDIDEESDDEDGKRRQQRVPKADLAREELLENEQIHAERLALVRALSDKQSFDDFVGKRPLSVHLTKLNTSVRLFGKYFSSDEKGLASWEGRKTTWDDVASPWAKESKKLKTLEFDKTNKAEFGAKFNPMVEDEDANPYIAIDSIQIHTECTVEDRVNAKQPCRDVTDLRNSARRSKVSAHSAQVTSTDCNMPLKNADWLQAWPSHANRKIQK